MSNGGTMFVNLRRKTLPRGLWRAASLVLALWLGAGAGLSWADPVKIEFLPPPMEGTISLGVYDGAGKLVRVLHREAEISEFIAGDDGLGTQWDGKDDHGAVAPAGTYRVRGVMVGDLGVEGVDFIGNDWVTDDDSPHLSRITGLSVSATGTPVITATLAGQSVSTSYSIVLKPSATPGEDPEPQLVAEPAAPADAPALPGLKPSAGGTHGTVWSLDGETVKQTSKAGKRLRALAARADDPPPVALAASTTEEKLYVLYENAQFQRLRGYNFTGVKSGAAPKELFENDLVFSERYEQIAPQLKFPDEKPFAPTPVLTVALIPNPLMSNKPGTLQIQAVVDKEGCSLATADGLPLGKVSDTPHLRWAVMGRPDGNKPITLFESDGAAVEEFQIAGIARMMAFDAGTVQWSPAAASPSPSASATPSVRPTEKGEKG